MAHLAMTSGAGGLKAIARPAPAPAPAAATAPLAVAATAAAAAGRPALLGLGLFFVLLRWVRKNKVLGFFLCSCGGLGKIKF